MSRRSGTGTVRATLRAERMVHGGRAVARKDGGEVVLLAGAIPGELVEAELERRRGVWLGTTVRVVEPSESRVAAPDHPGLDYGFVSYERQLALKAEVVSDSMSRAGLAGQVDGSVRVRAAPRVWEYRSVVQPAVTAGGLGYRHPESSRVQLLERDPTATPAVAAAWRTVVAGGVPVAAGVREVVFRGNDDGDVLVALITTAAAKEHLALAHELVAAGVAGVASSPFDPRGRFRGGTERLAGKRSILQSFGRLALTVNATSFSQPNPSAASELYLALTKWAGAGAHAWELFAGGGAIALHLAERFGAVTAVEVNRAAVARGQNDAKRLGIGNVRFARADARKAPLPADADLLVVDPPRAGLGADLRRAIAASGCRRLLYVSCDVATWARDVADLTAAGYELARYEPFDFYPHTHHVELLSELVLRGR